MDLNQNLFNIEIKVTAVFQLYPKVSSSVRHPQLYIHTGTKKTKVKFENLTYSHAIDDSTIQKNINIYALDVQVCLKQAIADSACM